MKDTTLNTATKKTPRRSPPKGFDYGSIPVEDKKALLELVAELKSIARKSAVEVFDLGRRFVDAKDRLPKRFDEWLKKECQGISSKTAFNYMSVHTRFAERRDEVVDLGLKPAHLYKLANAPEPAIEEVFGRVGDGEKVIGADVTRIIKMHSDPNDGAAQPKADRPLRKGLLTKLKPITEAAVDVWLNRLAALRDGLQAALPNNTWNRVIKGELEKIIMYDARWLERDLERMTGFGFTNNAYPYGRPQPERLSWPDKGRWHQVSRVLFSIGGISQIPATELETCIRSELLPVLDWALGHATAEDHLGAISGEDDPVDDELEDNDDVPGGLDVSSDASVSGHREETTSPPGQ